MKWKFWNKFNMSEKDFDKFKKQESDRLIKQIELFVNKMDI